LKQILEQFITRSKKKTITLQELQSAVRLKGGNRQWERDGSYESFARAINELVYRQVLREIKAAGFNGMQPPLPLRYRIVGKKPQTPDEIFGFKSKMDLSFYLDRPEEFSRHRNVLQSIDEFLLSFACDAPGVTDTVNERSLALAGDEKFLLSAEGQALLRNTGLSLSDLFCYRVAEPFFYSQFETPANKESITALVIENKDTHHTICRLLKLKKLTLVPAPDLAIYGEGNKITKSWHFLESLPSLAGAQVELKYFGDLDPEGFRIYGRLERVLKEEGGSLKNPAKLDLAPAEAFYRLLIKTGRSRPMELGTRNLSWKDAADICRRLLPGCAAQIIELWQSGRMIPQEALSASRLAEVGEVRL
jgi:hypothetical protein